MLLPFRWIGGVLQLPLGVSDLTIEYFDCPEDGVDIVPEGDGGVVVLGCLLVYFDGDVPIELILAGVGLC